MEFNFEFTDEEIKVIERLIGCDLQTSTKQDIMSFLDTYKFKQKFYQTEKKYAKIIISKEIKKIYFLYVDEIEDSNCKIRLKSTQTICYTYCSDNNSVVLQHSDITTITRERYENSKIRAYIDLYSNSNSYYEVEIITKEEYLDELVIAVNIN